MKGKIPTDGTNISFSLLVNLIERDISSKYKGSVLGAIWSILNPIMMLTVYTFVFSVVFKARWHGGTGSQTEFALLLFSGLIIFNIFSECVNRAPNAIVSNPNLVKKVVFPIHVLPIVALGTAIFQAIMSFFVWIVFHFLFFGIPPATIVLLPIVLIPLIFLTLGLSFVLASLSVYIRDLIQVVGIITTVLLFLSPIFYSVSMLPEAFQSLMKINPLTATIEQARQVMIWGQLPDASLYLLQLVISLFVFFIGYSIFNLTRRGFADVL